MLGLVAPEPSTVLLGISLIAFHQPPTRAALVTSPSCFELLRYTAQICQTVTFRHPTPGSCMQVEHKCEPRAPSAGPQKGQLPLPGDIEKDILDYRPAKVEDLNGLLPHDSPKLSTPDVHPKVHDANVACCFLSPSTALAISAEL